MCMKFQSLLSWENKNKDFKMSSATVFTQSAKCLRINKKDKYVWAKNTAKRRGVIYL